MNAARRKEAQRAIDLLDDAKEILDRIAQEEEEAAEALPESFAEQYEKSTEAAGELFEVADEIGEASSAIANAIEK